MKGYKGCNSYIIILFVIINIFLISPFIFADSVVNVKYIVEPEVNHFNVEAILENIHEDKVLLSFVKLYAGIDLTERIVDFQAFNGHERELMADKKDNGYLIKVDDNQKIILQYKLYPDKTEHNYHLATLTSTYLHIPGYTFALRIEDEEGHNLASDGFKIKLKNLPDEWAVLTTYFRDNEGFIIMDNYKEALIHAGEYKTYHYDLDRYNIIIAVDKAADFAINKWDREIETILGEYIKIFGRLPGSKALVVINQGRGLFDIGGQVKKQNVIIELGGILKGRQELFKQDILALFTHEVFHLWVRNDFKVSDNWSWFSEGMAEYQKYRVLRNTGIISDKRFKDLIKYDFYQEYYNHKSRDDVDLLTISMMDSFSEYSDLLYAKGALVAYLFDKELQKQDYNVDQFLKYIYIKYAINKRSLGNSQLLEEINNVLSSDTFTEKYIEGTEFIKLDNTGILFPIYAKLRGLLPPNGPSYPIDAILTIVVLLLLIPVLYLIFKFILYIYRITIISEILSALFSRLSSKKILAVIITVIIILIVLILFNNMYLNKIKYRDKIYNDSSKKTLSILDGVF